MKQSWDTFQQPSLHQFRAMWSCVVVDFSHSSLAVCQCSSISSMRGLLVALLLRFICVDLICCCCFYLLLLVGGQDLVCGFSCLPYQKEDTAGRCDSAAMLAPV
jgi:hypothetical protein